MVRQRRPRDRRRRGIGRRGGVGRWRIVGRRCGILARPAPTVDPAKLEHDAEKRLNELAGVVSAQIDEMIAERDYNNALQTFAAMAGELETFFDEVMVMVEDEAVRKNRMSLLRKVGNAVGRIADVTKIVVDRREYRA